MTRITRVTLKDFQSHKESCFEFTDGITVIIGSSNAGKSSLARALNFFFYGDWDKSYVRRGSVSTKICVVFEDGTEIVREKGEKVNRFVLCVGGKEMVYENFGQSIPGEIQKFLEVYPARLDVDREVNLNVSLQHDPLFLLSETGTVRAKALGRLSGSHIVDNALRELSRERKSLMMESQDKQTEFGEVRQELKEYVGIDEQTNWMEQLQRRFEQLEKKQEVLEKLQVAAKKLTDWEEQCTILKKQFLALEAFDEAEAKAVITKWEELKQYKPLEDALAEIVRDSAETRLLRTQTKEMLVQASNTLQQVLLEEKVCPLCFSSIDKEKVVLIIERCLEGSKT